MNMNKRVYIALLLSTALLCMNAQTITERIELSGSAGSGAYAPFWHMAGRQGISSRENCMAYLRNDLEGKHLFSKSGISIDWGAGFVAGYNMTYPVFVQQAYIDITWKKIRLSVGQKERWSLYGNRRMTTGALIESGNARPIPQVRIDMPEYWDIPGCKGWFGIKGHFAFGMFTDGCWQKRTVSENEQRTENVLYHSKELLLRFGNEKKFPLTAEMGIQMVTQFGGTIYNKFNVKGNKFKSPTRLKDFFLAVIPLKGDSQYDPADQVNVAGNVLGDWKGAITWNDKNWAIQLYYDHVFEDHSQMFWEYGLWTEQLVGVQLQLKRFKWIENVTFEYFNLKNQSGPIYHDSTTEIPDQISCADNNYWHHTYNGWFNYGMMIGTPLVTSPIYNNDKTLEIYNSRVEAFHAGIEGTPLEWLGYRMLFTYSNNWGTYGKPFKYVKQCTSGLVELTFMPKVFKGWNITASFAFDKGSLYGDNYGGMLSIKKEFVFNLKKKR